MKVDANISIIKFEAWANSDKAVIAEFRFEIPNINQSYSPPVRMSIPITEEMSEHRAIFETLIKEQIQKIVKDGTDNA